MEERHYKELKREFDRDPRNWDPDGPPADILLSAGVVAQPLHGPPIYSRHAMLRAVRRAFVLGILRPSPCGPHLCHQPNH